jgi:hypothetical protein
MGTTLTGTTPQDTYDSLIKVTDNGPLSATAKYLSDGLGNDSALALSTTALGIGTNTPVGKLTIAGTSAQPPSSGTTPNSLLQIKGSLGNQLNIGSNTATGDYGSYIQASDTNLAVPYPLNLQPIGGNVGIGTTPSAWDSTFRALQIGLGTTIYNNSTVNGSFLGSNYFYNGTNNIYKNTGTATAYGQVNGVHSFFTVASGTAGDIVSFTERVKIDADGLKFGSDTAAANALDDYEEGTWTMGVSFGGASVGVTYAGNTGTYTKIGRQVTVNGYLILSSKGSSSGAANITGLPFTIANSQSNLSTASLWLNSVTFLNQHQAVGKVNSTSVEFWEITTLGAATFLDDVNFANNSEVIINFTYFV